MQKGEGFGFLRQVDNGYRPAETDVFVPLTLVRRLGLRDGSLIEGLAGPPGRSGQKAVLREVKLVDGMDPAEARRLTPFNRLTSVDPDFQYELGDVLLEDDDDQGDTSLRVIDLLAPIGRGQRGVLVAPPRTGKTVLLQKIARAIEKKYPDVHLMVLLIDERPEEGTYWRRAIQGEVHVSTADELARNHILLAQGVWRRAIRLVECGHEVVLLLDSITRLARAYNNEIGNSGRILTGGIDSRTMEKPKKFFGSARNTEEGGSLTVIGTCLVDTGSKMDQVIFEEFKGTGNMEVVLSRMLADRRIFPSIDVGRSGTRREERLLPAKDLRMIQMLRRVLSKMKPVEAMELLIQKLEMTSSNKEFLAQFDITSYA